MIKRLENIQPTGHRWTFNDRVDRHFFNWVKIESPCIVHLYWKEDDERPEQFIGSFQLNLTELLEAGYARTDAEHPHQAFLRFQRSDDDKIQIALNKGSKALDCGLVLRS